MFMLGSRDSRVVSLLDTPTPATWPGLPAQPDWGKIELPTVPPTPLHERMPLVSDAAIDVVEGW